MKYFTIISFVLIFVSPYYVTSQSFHEINLNLIGIRNQQYKPAYEYIIDGRFGLSFISGFDLRDEDVRKFDLINPTSQSFSATRFIPTLLGKFYPFNNKRKASGFFLGPYLSFEILLNRDDNYAMAWVDNLTSLSNDPRFQVPSDISKTSGLLGIKPGVNSGYKFLIKDHFIFEIFSFMTYDSQFADVELLKSGGLDFEMDFKIGYRF